jgi:23S rRNA (adenine1618-N6)-methyltransferase
MSDSSGGAPAQCATADVADAADAACEAALADLELEVALGAVLDADGAAARDGLRAAVAEARERRPPPVARAWGGLGRPDFGALAAADPRLKPYVAIDSQGRARIDFSDGAATRALVAALLRAAFAVEWWVPAGALVPPVPSRVEYLDVVARLLAQVAPEGVSVGGGAETLAPPFSPPTILDVGVGANAIYCLLAAARGWRAVGLDAARAALAGAAANLSRNPALAPRITLRACPSPDFAAVGILPHGLRAGDPVVAACVCNPPFFESASARAATARASSDYGGTPAETVCVGGEVAFVGRLVEESEEFKEKIVWFSAMLGRKASLSTLKRSLAALDPAPSIRVVEMRAGGGRTARWVLAWTWWARAARRRTREAT